MKTYLTFIFLFLFIVFLYLILVFYSFKFLVKNLHSSPLKTEIEKTDIRSLEDDITNLSKDYIKCKSKIYEKESEVLDLKSKIKELEIKERSLNMKLSVYEKAYKKNPNKNDIKIDPFLTFNVGNFFQKPNYFNPYLGFSIGLIFN